MTWQTFHTTLTNKQWKHFGTVSSPNKTRLNKETKEVVERLRRQGLLVKYSIEFHPLSPNPYVLVEAKLPSLSRFEGKANVVQKRSGNKFVVPVAVQAKNITEGEEEGKKSH